jgi:hypothetical protein
MQKKRNFFLKLFLAGLLVQAVTVGLMKSNRLFDFTFQNYPNNTYWLADELAAQINQNTQIPTAVLDNAAPPIKTRNEINQRVICTGHLGGLYIEPASNGIGFFYLETVPSLVSKYTVSSMFTTVRYGGIPAFADPVPDKGSGTQHEYIVTLKGKTVEEMAGELSTRLPVLWNRKTMRTGYFNPAVAANNLHGRASRVRTWWRGLMTIPFFLGCIVWFYGLWMFGEYGYAFATTGNTHLRRHAKIRGLNINWRLAWLYFKSRNFDADLQTVERDVLKVQTIKKRPTAEIKFVPTGRNDTGSSRLDRKARKSLYQKESVDASNDALNIGPEKKKTSGEYVMINLRKLEEELLPLDFFDGLVPKKVDPAIVRFVLLDLLQLGQRVPVVNGSGHRDIAQCKSSVRTQCRLYKIEYSDKKTEDAIKWLGSIGVAPYYRANHFGLNFNNASLYREHGQHIVLALQQAHRAVAAA